MSTLDLIYVTTGRHPELEALICKTTNSQFSHAAIGFEMDGRQVIVEAVRPAIRFAPAGEFNGAPALQIISLPITEDQRQAVVSKALELVGKPYGVDDCIIGGVHDLLGDAAANLADRLLDNSNTLDCSATQVEIARAVFPDFASGADASTITPEQARQIAVAYAERLGVTV